MNQQGARPAAGVRAVTDLPVRGAPGNRRPSREDQRIGNKVLLPKLG
jgi:hypothetical protein